jgi:hypothetical protein
MEHKSNGLYTLLIIGAVIATIIIVYLLVGTYYNVPLTSLIPFTTKIEPTTSPQGARIEPSGKKLVPVQKFTLPSGLVLYVVTGKFVSAPAYNAQGILQGDFVINEDPVGHKIPVIMAKKTDKISYTKSTGSFDGKTVVGTEDVETLRTSIVVNAPAQLRIYPITPGKTPTDILVQKVMDGIIGGNWSILGTFTITPNTVGVIQ